MRGLLVLFLLLAAACESVPMKPRDPTSVATALATWGDVREIEREGSPRVVIIADRHPIGAGITFLPEGHRRQQKEQSRAVAWLVDNGYRLMGCEFAKGPLPTDGPAEAHRASIREVLDEGDDLDRWSHFQPVRYEWIHRGSLRVVGVEDPDLYAADVRDLESILDIREFRRRRSGSEGPDDATLDAREKALLGRIRSHVDARGRLAASNLLDEAARTGAEAVILFLGAAHCGAAAGECAARGAAVTVWSPASLRR